MALELINFSTLNHKIIDYRLRWKSDRLKNGALNKSPDISIKDPLKKEQNILARKLDLSNAVYQLYSLNNQHAVFYGTSLVKFACNQLIKSWPWIDGNTDVNGSFISKHKIEHLEDLFGKPDILAEDFYYHINQFQEKYGELWRKHISRKKINRKFEKIKDINITIANIFFSKGHLAQFLFSLYNIYKKDPGLYGQIFKAYFGNWIVREWPKKDLPFTSLKYNKSEKSIYEHYTPISFFRDMLDDEILNKNFLSEKDFHDALLYFYRVIYIHKETEDDELNKRKFKTSRPVNAYQICDIKISESDLWNKLYSEFDNKIFSSKN